MILEQQKKKVTKRPNRHKSTIQDLARKRLVCAYSAPSRLGLGLGLGLGFALCLFGPSRLVEPALVAAIVQRDSAVLPALMLGGVQSPMTGFDVCDSS